MVLLQQAQIPRRYHRRAIADGMLLAILLRVRQPVPQCPPPCF